MIRVRKSWFKTLTMVLAVGVVTIPFSGTQAYQRPGVTERISVDSSGREGQNIGPNWTGWGTSMSADGRYAAFETTLSGLVPNDHNLTTDVFVRDRRSFTTVMASVSSAGIPGAGASVLLPQVSSVSPALSETGRFVAFTSHAPNLVPGDTNGAPDVFVRDLKRGTTERVSVSSDGSESHRTFEGQTVGAPVDISADGRFVSFYSDAADLVPEDPDNQGDVFVHDRKTDRTELVSISPAGETANGIAVCPSMSSDGRYVLFSSTATNLVDIPDAPLTYDVFVRDRLKKKTEIVSIASDGSKANLISGTCSATRTAAISADGRAVVFMSNATNLVPNDGNRELDVFRRDLRTGRTTLVSTSSMGAVSDRESSFTELSADGRFVVFLSLASNLSPEETPSEVPLLADTDRDLFLHDTRTGATEMLTVSLGGSKSSCVGRGPNAAAPSISADGRYVSFFSCAYDLTSQPDGNLVTDAFVRDRGSVLSSKPDGASPRLMDRRGREVALGTAFRGDAVSDQVTMGAETDLIGLGAAYRPATDDILVTLELRGMARSPVLFASTQGQVFGATFGVGDETYELRAASTGLDARGSTEAEFALFTCKKKSSQECRWVADLEGAFGTTGDRISFSLPARYVSASDGGNRDIIGLTAFTSLGTLATGPLRFLDKARL